MNRTLLLGLPKVLTLFVLGALTTSARAADPRNYAVEVSATVQTTPPQITLKWPVDANATGYAVYRKAPADKSWTFLSSLGGGTTSWNDLSVTTGAGYEYGITKSTSAGYSGTGYFLAGINA